MERSNFVPSPSARAAASTYFALDVCAGSTAILVEDALAILSLQMTTQLLVLVFAHALGVDIRLQVDQLVVGLDPKVLSLVVAMALLQHLHLFLSLQYFVFFRPLLLFPQLRFLLINLPLLFFPHALPLSDPHRLSIFQTTNELYLLLQPFDLQPHCVILFHQ